MTEEFRQMVFEMWGYKCAYPGCHRDADDVHHALVHDTKRNRILYPLLSKCLFIFRPICKICHQVHQHFWNISDMRAAILERWLRNYKEGKNE